MTISIVMTTYNGEKYILEQLHSLLQQNRKADEVIVLDDCSTDNTVEIVKNFIQANHLEHWRVCVNDKNVGWKQNFVNGFELASGDLVFPCDQDDIWLSDKLEIMEKLMEENQHIDLLSGDAEYFFEKKPSVERRNTREI